MGLSLFAWLQEEWEKESVGENSGLFEFRAGEIEKLHLKYPGSDRPSVVLVRSDEGWTLEEPVKAQVNLKVIMGFIHSLAAYQSGKLISKNLESLADYGLESPAIWLGVNWSRQGQSFYSELSVGSDSVVGYGVYLRDHNKGKIWLGSRHLKLLLRKSVMDWRERVIIDLNIPTLNKFSFSAGSGEGKVYERGEKGFCQPGNMGKCLGSGTVQLLSKIAEIRVEGFILRDPGDIFNKTDYRLEWWQAGDSQRSLKVRFYGGSLLAQYLDSPELLELPVSVMEAFEALRKDIMASSG